MDADLLEELYRKYYASALLYCTSLCGDPVLAQDITSDAFLKAYLSLPNDVPSFRYWLLRVCKNLWYDHLRAQKHITSEEALQWMADHITPEYCFLQNERSRCLWKAIQELPDIDREILILHYFSGVSLQEIAKITGRSYAGIRQRMSRLRKHRQARSRCIHQELRPDCYSGLR